MQLLEQIIATVAPHSCFGCGAEGNILCTACTALLPPTPRQCYRCGKLDERGRTCRSCRSSSALKSVWAVASYDGLAKEVVASLKFERAQAAAKDIAHAMATHANGDTERMVIAHVPTANVRVRTRGYDQAALIARELSRKLGVPHAALLARVSNVRQLGASRQQRKVQLSNAFRPLKSYMILNNDVLLVDDVITTGSTLEAAANVLKANGARSVQAIVFARA